MENCIFCKIANGEIPSATLYEDEDFRVILDLGPAAKGHSLILPKSHAANIYELPDETAEQWRDCRTDRISFPYASDSALRGRPGRSDMETGRAD